MNICGEKIATADTCGMISLRSRRLCQ